MRWKASKRNPRWTRTSAAGSSPLGGAGRLPAVVPETSPVGGGCLNRNRKSQEGSDGTELPRRLTLAGGSQRPIRDDLGSNARVCAARACAYRSTVRRMSLLAGTVIRVFPQSLHRGVESHRVGGPWCATIFTSWLALRRLPWSGPYLTEEAAEDGARFARLVNYRIEHDPSPYDAQVR